MAHAIRLSDLAAMTTAERAEVLGRAAAEAAAVPNGHATAAFARVRAFEARYEMSSDRLLTALQEGQMRETAEIVEWLFWLRLSRSVAEE